MTQVRALSAIRDESTSEHVNGNSHALPSFHSLADSNNNNNEHLVFNRFEYSSKFQGIFPLEIIPC